MTKATLSQKLSDLIRVELAKKAEVSDLPEDLQNLMANGQVLSETKADMLIAKVVRLAVDPNRVNEFAIQLIFDRVEGKPATAQMENENVRAVEEKLSDVTKQHLNALAAEFGQQERATGIAAPQPPSAAVQPTGPARRLLDLPQDRAGSPEAGGG